MQTPCQWFMLGQLVCMFLASMIYSYTGRPKKPPTGFAGFIGSIMGLVFTVAVWYKAGAFSVLFGQ